jgi:hypothetical protein
MNGSVLLDITQIPSQLGGLAGLTSAIAVAFLAFLIPVTILELNVSGLQAKEYPDYSGLFMRVLVAVTALLGYRSLFGFILNVAQTMGFAVLSEDQWGSFLVQSFHGVGTGVPTLNILMHPVSSFQEILLFLSSLIAVTSRDVIIMLQGCFLSLLFAFGPIAIVFSINKRTAQMAQGWLTNTVQVAFWSFFLRLVVRVWLTLNPMATTSGTGAANDYLGILTVNISFLTMVLGTPMLTARLLSGDNIAMFGEAALGAVQTIMIAKKLGAGMSVARGIDNYRRAAPQDKNFMNHPLPHTATFAFQKLFGKGAPSAPPASQAPAPAPAPIATGGGLGA